MNEPIAWRIARESDLDDILAIQAVVHAAFPPEGRPTFARKIALFPQGCRMLVAGGVSVGYGIGHPWRLGTAPPLDTVLDGLPEKPECLFVHDVALLSPARGLGAGSRYIKAMRAEARHLGIEALALVSVYGTVPIWERCGFTVRADPASMATLSPYGPTARYMVADSGSPVVA